jgi:hypothetical protein
MQHKFPGQKGEDNAVNRLREWHFFLKNTVHGEET